MAINKVDFYGNTLIDISSDTVDATHLAQGYTAHTAAGDAVVGTLSFVTYYTSANTPTSSQGNNGDIWLVTL